MLLTKKIEMQAMAQTSSIDDVPDPSETDGYSIALDKACPTVLHYTEEGDDKDCLNDVGKLEAGQ